MEFPGIQNGACLVLICEVVVWLMAAVTTLGLTAVSRQRRALRTAPEKLRNRTSFSANVAQSTPGTRVNRYIGRLIEARQTESETADLHVLTLTYRHSEREHKVSRPPGSPHSQCCCISLHVISCPIMCRLLAALVDL